MTDSSNEKNNSGKEVGITTFFCALSFGAVLQSTALVKVVRSFGHDAKILNLQPKRRLFSEKISLLHLVRNFLYLLHIRSYKRKVNRFDEFIRTNQVLTRRYFSP